MKILELGHVVLYVTDVEKAANFYKNILGFHEIERQDGMAIFSSGRTHHELLLIEVGGTKRKSQTPQPGLYHIGLKVGNSHSDIVKVFKELVKNGVNITGTGDHGVTHSIYITDPDGNELELYADVSDEWKKNPKAVLAPVRHLDLE